MILVGRGAEITSAALLQVTVWSSIYPACLRRAIKMRRKVLEADAVSSTVNQTL